ncbi:MarR family transcriptional regulator [Lachnospiraceae bacterium 29-91]
MDRTIKDQIDTINQRIKELNSLYHIAAIKSDISDGEISIWSVLLESDGEYSQQDLSDLLFLPKQTINSIISNLVKKGFVFLEHVPGTRNRKVIRLTEEGRDYGESKVRWIFQAEEKALEQTDPEQVQACIEMIEKYISHLKKEFDEK